MIVESGNYCNNGNYLPFMMSALAKMGYDAIGLGDTEVREQSDAFYTEAQKDRIPVVDSYADARKTTVPFVIKNVGGVKVGIISFGATIPDANRDEMVWRKAMYAAYREARAASKILIVLDQGNVITEDWLMRNGPRFGEPDVVIGGIVRSGMMQEQTLGKTHIVPTGVQGKSLGVLDFEIDGDKMVAVCQKVMLEESVVQDPDIKAGIDKLLGREAIAVTSQPGAQTTQNTTQPTVQPGMQPVSSSEKMPMAPGRYYPPATCKACHVKEYDDWATSKHAHALQTLIDAKRVIPDCVPCHSEEYRRTNVVGSPSNGLGGVDCSACHYDVLPHGLDRKTSATHGKVDATLCVSCHTKERSPGYDEQAYFPKVMHKTSATAQAGKAP